MRRVGLILLLVVFVLTGCSLPTGEVENQAYALVLGIDRTVGGIELTIRIPRIGHSGDSNSDSEASGRPYLVLAAAGESYAQALEHLHWASARELNLSHVKLIVVSEALAYDEAFRELISRVAETRHLYTTAGFVVCEGSARAFIEGQETILGAHLSSELTAQFRHYAAHGYIPRATFAELYYATRACYSDPTGIWGFMDAGERPAAATITGDADKLNADTLTASDRQYLGTALFRDGRMVGRLSARETLYLDLLTGRVESFTFDVNGSACALSTLTGPRRSVRFDGDRVTLEARLSLTAEDSANRALLDRVEEALALELEALVRRCQTLGVEPFGFAERAAMRFPTYARWLAFDWRERFSQANVDISVEIYSASA